MGLRCTAPLVTAYTTTGSAAIAPALHFQTRTGAPTCRTRITTPAAVTPGESMGTGKWAKCVVSETTLTRSRQLLAAFPYLRGCLACTVASLSCQAHPKPPATLAAESHIESRKTSQAQEPYIMPARLIQTTKCRHKLGPGL